MRFGFTPLYIGYADVDRAIDQLTAVLGGAEWSRTPSATR